MFWCGSRASWEEVIVTVDNTASEANVALVLDLRGLPCPLPVVRISTAMKELEIGQVIEATATDPGVMIDIPAWAKSTGNDLLILEERDDYFLFRVRRNE